MAEQKMKPCPFCGSNKLVVRDGVAECESCGVTGPLTSSLEESIALWNQRILAAERVTREELAEALRDLHLYEPVADGRCLFCLGTRPSQCRPVDHAPLCLWAASKRVLSRLDAEQNGGGE